MRKKEDEEEDKIEVQEGESLEDIKAKLKPKKSAISPDMLDTANTYDDKVAVIRMIVGDEAGRVSSVFKALMKQGSQKEAEERLEGSLKVIKNNLSSNLNNNEKGDDNNPLSNEELSRLIKASKEGAFQSKKIKKDIEESFKKVSLHDIAKNYSQNAGSTNDSGSKVKEDESLEKFRRYKCF